MMILEGAISVKAALECRKRVVEKIMILDKKHSKDLNYILFLCHQQQIPVEFVAQADLLAIASKQHGGVIAMTFERKFETLHDVSGRCLFCEGIEDPYNLGMMMRTAYCAGYETVLLPKRDYHLFEPVLMKSSAGAFERLKVVLLSDLSEDCQTLVDQGYQFVAAMRGESSVDYRVFTFPKQLVLCIGGEKRGLSRPILDISGAWVEIKYPASVKIALSAVSSCSILCFESVWEKGNKFSD